MGDIVEFENVEVIEKGRKSDQELINQGRDINRRTDKLGRELGEWFNSVKLGRPDARTVGAVKYQGTDRCPDILTAKEICKRAGWNYGTAKNYGLICSAFPTEESQRGFKFTTCRELLPAFNKLGAKEFHGRFMPDAAAGVAYQSDFDPDYVYTQPWNEKDIKRQVGIVTGKALPVSSELAKEQKKKMNATVDEVLADSGLQKNKQNKIRTALKKQIAQNEKDLLARQHDEVNAKVAEIVNERTAEKMAEIEALKKQSKEHVEYAKGRRKEADDLRIKLRDMSKDLSGFMTLADFRLVLNCLHPDRAPEGSKSKFQKAFNVMQPLGDAVKRWDK